MVAKAHPEADVRNVQMTRQGVDLIVPGHVQGVLAHHREMIATTDGKHLFRLPAPVLPVPDLAGELTEIDLEDDGVLISRSISNSSRGKTFLGSRSISGNVLKDLTQDLVTIHGQGDQTSLNKSTYQRALLDTYIGSEHLENLKKYEESYRFLNELEHDLNELIKIQICLKK